MPAQTQHREGKSQQCGRKMFMRQERSQTVKAGVKNMRRIYKKLLQVAVKGVKITNFHPEFFLFS